MALKYRVSLPGIKGFARVYEVKDSTTLYSFSNQMKADMHFPKDQMVLFKAMADDGQVSARYGVFDLGAGTIDKVTLGQTLKKGEHSFIFFYDTTNAKSVTVTFEGNVDLRGGIVYPWLVESKGPDPVEFENGYVAYEDLPEDKKKEPGADNWGEGFSLDLEDDEDDEDGDDEDGDDEDTPEIYVEEED